MAETKMKADALIQEVYRKATGELDSAVTADTEDGQTILSVINEQIDNYYSASDRFGSRVVWFRNVDPAYEVGQSDGSTDAFDVDWDEISAFPAGMYQRVSVVTDSGKTSYDLVPLNELYDNGGDGSTLGNRCAITSEGLLFSPTPAKGSIRFPAEIKGSHLSGTETDVESVCGVHNLRWLVSAAAAEYCRTDLVRGAQYPNILAQANDLFSRMVEDNDARTASLEYGW